MTKMLKGNDKQKIAVYRALMSCISPSNLFKYSLKDVLDGGYFIANSGPNLTKHLFN